MLKKYLKMMRITYIAGAGTVGALNTRLSSVCYKSVGVRAERSGVRISATLLFYWVVSDLGKVVYSHCLSFLSSKKLG